MDAVHEIYIGHGLVACPRHEVPFRAVFLDIQEHILLIPEIDIVIAPESRAKQIERAKEMFCKQRMKSAWQKIRLR